MKKRKKVHPVIKHDATRLRQAHEALERSTRERWTRTRLCEAVSGVSRQSVDKWFTGKTRPRGDALLRLAAVLRVSPDWLVGGGEDAETSPPRTDEELALALGHYLTRRIPKERQSYRDYSESVSSLALGQSALDHITRAVIAEVDGQMQQWSLEGKHTVDRLELSEIRKALERTSPGRKSVAHSFLSNIERRLAALAEREDAAAQAQFPIFSAARREMASESARASARASKGRTHRARD